MAYSNSRGGSGDRPAKRSFGTDRSSGGEGKKIFNRNDKGRPSDSRDRKPYGDSPKGGYAGNARSERPYNSDRSDRPSNSGRSFNSDRPYKSDRPTSDRPYKNDRPTSGRPYKNDRPTSDRPYKNDRSFGSDRPYKNERATSDRPYNNRTSDRSSRPEGGDKEFRPYRPAAKRPTDDRPWVARAERSGQGSVPRGGKGERNRSFKPEKEEYRSRQEAVSSTEPRRDSDGFAPREEKRSYSERPSNRTFNNDRNDRPARSYDGDRKPYAKKDYGSTDKKPFGSSDRGYSKDRGFNKDDRSAEGNRFSREMRASRENQGSKEGRETRVPRETRFNSSREERPGRPDRYADRTSRSTQESVGEAPNYSGLKRYSGRDKNRSEDLSADGQLRLNRYIANAGICSRREADELITAGEIRVNGEVVTELGYKVKPTDSVQYGKKNLSREKLVYVLLNKPKDFITTTDDPEGRKTVMDLVKNASKERIFPVGRLDRNTTGLLLFTNDGELAQKLTHPSHKNSKIYQVELDKPITKDHFQQIVDGLELEDGKADVDDLALIGNTNKFLGIEIHIGRNRIVRRIFESLGYEVVTLDRVQYAGLTKKDLPRGNWRFLNEKEVIRLKFFL